MEVILLRDMRDLGSRGEVVDVKPGYARNYLLPQGYALTNTKGNRDYFVQQRKKIDALHQKEREVAASIAASIADLRIEIRKRVGESETLYGSVTANDIAEKLLAKGVTVDRRRIEMPDGHGIKKVGDHIVGIDLHPEVTAELTVSVVPADE